MKPEIFELKTHQAFELEKAMRVIGTFSQSEIEKILLDLMTQIMIKDNVIRFLLKNGDVPLSPDTFKLTLEQEFSYQQMTKQRIEKVQAISLIEQASRLHTIKNNVVEDLLKKLEPLQTFRYMAYCHAFQLY